MKTILIYDQCGETPIRFAVLPGDYSHLNGVYVNSTACTEEECDELSSLVYVNGQEKLRFTTKFPREMLLAHPDTAIIVAGFLP